jgi:hypothetical protein
MSRFAKTAFSASALVLSVAALLSACDGGGHKIHAGPVGGGGPRAQCAGFSTCDTCTPANGCGWCFNGDGAGSCVADPDECSTKEFSFTWDPVGCHASADASVVSNGDAAPAPSDASTATDATFACRIPATATIAVDAGEAGASGCTPSQGGDLCAAASYTLTCTGSGAIPVPDAALGCQAVRTPTPANVLFYCCPCD